ncbi:DNA methyltransferase [Sphingomonas sp.]|uniref:DNA methyltransferase n=1 Tax=Sphingomonas sp. TaxID=28214 RepID=UPI003D6CCA4C
MRLSWNEIRARAATFAAEWAGQGYEKGDTQTFYNEFFEMFGVRRRSIARFENHVKKLDNKSGFIDLFWPGVLIVEQKSVGRDLVAAYDQAGAYFDSLKEADRPRYILLSDFQSFELHDLDERQHASFKLADLPANIDKFGFILGVQKRTFQDQDPVNIKAAELVGKLHDALEESGYTGYDLERFLVRLVFCLFADDTGVFEPRGIFLEFLETRTNEDGSDLGGWLTKLFEVLDTQEDKRSKNLDEDLAQFPYVNGDLFKTSTRIPDFNRSMREALIEVSAFDWSPISPAIFGSLFQSVMDRAERRRQGAHYTTEKNILKVIGPLFLDELRAEFERLKALRIAKIARLTEFQEKLSKLRFLDPACGCGNFLVIAYRELRLLELDVLTEIFAGKDQLILDVSALSKVDVDQFAGIEIGEFASRIAETAMWMMDHIMNSRLSLAFGKSYVRIPLRKSPVIRHDDALNVAWESVLPPDECTHVLGNPPFIGHALRDDDQKAGMHRVWGRDGQVNRLDYVTCWFKLATDYAQKNPTIKIAFVSTNSICQGEQASILWPPLFRSGARIFFAHRTFQWLSEARGKAAVHVIIVGLDFDRDGSRQIYDYDNVKGDPHMSIVPQINSYLISSPQIFITARGRPPAGMPKLFQGSKPADGARLKGPNGKYVTTSNLILDEEDRKAALARESGIAKWLRPYVGGQELISGEWRWCLWLKNATPAELKSSPEIQERLARVKNGRLQSPTDSVREFAATPWVFTQDRQPSSSYLAVPEVSSETREYIPICVLDENVIGSNKLLILPKPELWIMAVLTSAMHMGWMRTVAGRLESRYSYAPNVYNSFPWPVVDDADKAKLDASAKAIVAAREACAPATLEDMYDAGGMPVDLRKAHKANDRLVDRLYRKESFATERERVEHLFNLFQTRSAPLVAASAKQKRKSGKKS